MEDVANKVLADIYAHAEEAFPEECCGLVVNVGHELRIVRADNVSHAPRESFKIDPVFYLRHVDNVELIYHSHPNSSSALTDADKASSERVGKPFIVVGWPAGDVSRYVPDGSVAPLEGRSFVYGIFDCLAIVEDYYAEQGIDLPRAERPPYNWWEGTRDYAGEWYERNGFKLVSQLEMLQEGDVLVMRIGPCKVPNHVGVYLNGSLILHHTLDGLSRVEVYGGYWRKHTVKVLRRC